MLVLAVLAACSFQHGSPSAQAGDGATPDTRRAIDARAIDARPIDARQLDAPDACAPIVGACALAGGSCKTGTCVITPTVQGDVTCPPGIPCQIDCSTANTCDGPATLDCSQATSCAINCSASNTCNGTTIDCDHADCTVTCTFDNICSGLHVSDSGSTCAFNCCGGGTNECKGDTASPTNCSFPNDCPPENPEN